jgi:hypothetical protein
MGMYLVGRVSGVPVFVLGVDRDVHIRFFANPPCRAVQAPGVIPS